MGKRRSAMTTVVVAMVAAASAARVVETASALQQSHAAARDVIVAGGIDGRVYAMNAWTGDVLWMFDSGGPMVDSSSCGVHADAAETHWRASTATTPATTTTDQGSDDTLASTTTTTTTAMTGASASTAVSSAALSQMVPSYDGRLYHIDGTNVRELDMTMVDIINANGPVRLAHSSPAADADNTLSDLLLFGEKSTKLFSLDASKGIIQPFATASQTPTILFGRAEFKTRAVHARNMSAARCFTISEYFLQFADQSQCAKNTDGTKASSPHILVLPKDPDAAHPDEEESTIAAYDPWTNKQLWERQIPKFDVIAVYGVSANRGASFFRWTIEGPSSSTQPKKDLVISQGQSGSAAAPSAPVSSYEQPSRPLIGPESSSDVNNESKHLVKTVARDMATMESEYRLRLLDGNYYLEPNDDETDVRASTSGSSSDGYKPGFAKRKKRVFWEAMESGGKKGVFITYYHVGAMTLGALVGCILIAWGFYVKGLTASGALNTIEHDFTPTGHVHQLTIEQPGRDKITISSSITRALLLEAAVASGFVPQQVPLLENGEDTFAGSNKSTTSQVQLDPVTEAMLLEKFTKMVALEAAAALSGTRLSASNLIQLENDPDSSRASTMTSSTVTLVSSASATHSHRLSIQAEDSSDLVLTSSEPSSNRSMMTEDNEGRIVPVIEELESSTDVLVAAYDCEQVVESITNDSTAMGVDDTSSSVQSGSKSGGSWDSDTTGSCGSSKGCSSSGEEEGASGAGDVSVESSSLEREEQTHGSASASETSNPRKVSNASSSSSDPNEAEVLFPFVCQSRFANEFEELSALGKGGFGQVMLAENRLDGRKYAIKRVGLHLKNQTSKTLQKFLREVKILALLDHPHIVRYYQAWLEKVEEGAIINSAPFSDGGSDATGTAPPRNYSMSNLLAPISEMEFSNQHRSVASFYSSGSLGEDDGGFDWERNSDDGDGDVDAWREEDLAPNARSRAVKATKLPSIIEPNLPPKAAARAPRETDNDDTSCYSDDRCDHWLYIQMQYCAGRNLADYLSLPTRKMELPKLLKTFTQIASAIAHVHSCGLIHRDLKPANIFVADTEGDSIKLGDFGLSRYAANVNLTSTTTTEEQSTTNMFLNGGQGAQYSVSKWSMSMSNMSESQDITAGVGTYLYASPEQVAGKKYNAKTDMYSLGMILFELCHERFGTTMERYVTLRNARERIFPGDFVWRKKCPEIMDMLQQLLHPDALSRPDASEVVQWSQELYEMSLAQHHHASSTMRSPIHHSRSFQGTIPTLGLDHVADSTAFSLQVEARMDSESEESGSGGSGDRRLPNHNLLKELCDVIAEVSGGRMEIKKCGLHLQDGGAQILDFVLDPHLSEEERADLVLVENQHSELIKVIEALPGVHTVRLGR